MKKNNLYLYLYSNEITIFYNGNTYYIKSKSIEDSTIKNVSLFKQELNNILKKYKINYGLVSDNITFINILNTNLEKEYIKIILNEYNFKNIVIADLSKYLDKKTYIINDKNIIYFIKENIKVENINAEMSIKELIEKDKIKKEIFILKYNNKELIKRLKENDIEIYYIYNPKDIIIDKLTKQATSM